MNSNQNRSARRVSFAGSTGKSSDSFFLAATQNQDESFGLQDKNIFKNRNIKVNLREAISCLPKNSPLPWTNLDIGDLVYVRSKSPRKDTNTMKSKEKEESKLSHNLSQPCTKVSQEEFEKSSISLGRILNSDGINQEKHHRSPTKKSRSTLTKPLIIERLKCDFQQADTFVTKIRARRNWCPEFLTRYFRENLQKEENLVPASKKTFSKYVPEKPKVFSIGLYGRSNKIRENYNIVSQVDCAIKNIKTWLEVAEPRKSSRTRHCTVYQGVHEDDLSSEISNVKCPYPLCSKILVENNGSVNKCLLSSGKHEELSQRNEGAEFLQDSIDFSHEYKFQSRLDSATKSHHYEEVARGLKGTVHDHRKHELSKNHYRIDDLKLGGNRSTRKNEKSHKKQSCTCQNNETSLNHPRGTDDSVMIKRKRRVSKQCLENMKKTQDLEADLRRKADDFISNEITACEKINDPFVLGSSVTKLQEVEDSLGTSKIPLHVSMNHYRQLTKTSNDSDLVDQDNSKNYAKSGLRKKAYNEYKIQKYQEKYKRRSTSRSTRRYKSKNFISKDNDILSSKELLNVQDDDTVIYTDDNSSYVNIEDVPKNVKIPEKQYLTAESVLLEDQWTIRSSRSGSRKDVLSVRQENYYKMVSESKVTEARLLDDIKRRIDQDFEESFYCKANDVGVRSSLSSFEFDDNFGTRAVNEKAPDIARDSALNHDMRVKSEDSSKADDIFNLPREKLRNSRSASGMDDYVTVYSNDTQICSRPYSNLDLVSSKNFDNITRRTSLEQRYSLCDGESNESNILHRNYFHRRELLFENSKKVSQLPVGIENSISIKSINNLSNYSDYDKSPITLPWKTSKLNLVESVDSGVLTDFSKNDLHRNSQNDDMSDNKNKIDLEAKKNSAMRNDFLVSDSDDDSDVFLSKKLEKAVETFTEKLIMCERRAKARARQKNACILLKENTKHRKSKKKSQKDKKVQCSSERNTKTIKSSYSITDPSKASQWSSEEEQIADLSTPSLFSLSDSEIESSEFIQPRNRIIFGRRI